MKSLKKNHFGFRECPGPDGSQGRVLRESKYSQSTATELRQVPPPALCFYPLIKYHKLVLVKLNIVVDQGIIKSRENLGVPFSLRAMSSSPVRLFKGCLLSEKPEQIYWVAEHSRVLVRAIIVHEL